MFKNRLVYSVVVFVLFLFIYLRDSSMTYTAFYTVLILPIISFILARLSKYKLDISEELSNNFITKNEITEYKVSIQNRSFLPCFLARIRFDFEAIGLSGDADMAYLSIKSFGSYESIVKISGKFRGIYELGVKEVVIYDFLGIFKFKPAYNKGLKLTITPQILKLPELIIDVTQQGETEVKKHLQGKDLSMVSELREYQPTDSYKQIHWKATAKRNQLISKNPQEIEQLTTVFFVHNKRGQQPFQKALEREDKLMDVVVSAMSYCHHLGHRMTLQFLRPHYLSTMRDSNRSFTTDFTRLYHDAATLPFGEFGDFNVLLNEYLSFENTLENVFIFMQDVDENLIASLQAFKFAGSRVTLFLFGTVTKELMRKMESLDIHCICFD